MSSISSDIASYRYDDSRTDYNIHTYLTYNQANEIAQDIAGTMIPKIKEGVQYEGFGGQYYVGYEVPLHIIYIIGGIQYRFIYSYNVTETYENKDKVALRNVSIGSTSFELYAGEGRGYGTFMLGTTEVYVSVATDDPEAVNFECFEFVTITRNP